MTTYFTADWHLDHDAILRHANRPFANTEEMADVFFQHTNAVLSRGDQLWMLGDFCWRASNAGKWMARFNRGVQIHVALGNHDAGSLRKYVSSAQDMACRMFSVGDGKGECGNGSDSKIKIHLCHYPLFSWRAREHGSYHLYGHSHGMSERVLNELFPERLAMDVGIDVAWRVLGEWRPFAIDEVVRVITERNETPRECRQCGMVSSSSTNCVHCGGVSCMVVCRPPMVGEAVK